MHRQHLQPYFRHLACLIRDKLQQTRKVTQVRQQGLLFPEYYVTLRSRHAPHEGDETVLAEWG